MKKILLILFLSVIIFSNDAICQLKESEVRVMLCHKWKAATIESEGKRMKFPLGEEYTMAFLSDGTFLDVDDQKKISKGKWTYVHAKMTITIRGGIKKILKINRNELKIQSDAEDTIITLKRAD